MSKTILTPAQIKAAEAMNVLFKAFPNRAFILLSVPDGGREVEITSNLSSDQQKQLLVDVAKSIISGADQNQNKLKKLD